MISRAGISTLTAFDGDNAVATLNRVLPPLVSLVAAILIAWQLARIIWLLMPGSAAGDPVEVPDFVPGQSVAAGSTTDVTAIAAVHLFGTAVADDAAPVATAPADDENLNDTNRADLVLKGTVASRQDEYAIAVIAAGSADDKVYRVGDALGRGTKLHAVYPDRVVLDENGALTNLRLPRDFSSVSVSNSVRSQTAQTRQTTDNIQAVVSNNLTKLTDVIRPTPYMSQGKPAGYRVYPGRNRAQFAALGLRPGDIIKDIDGQSLTDPTRAMQIFQSLGQAQQVTVTVERNGQPETLVLSTEQLDLGNDHTQ